MGTTYDQDIIAWANEQAALLKAGKFSDIDIEHVADEIEDVGKSEKRDFANSMAVLLGHLTKWQFQPDLRGPSWKTLLRIQRTTIAQRITQTPSLKPMLKDDAWISQMWRDASQQAAKEMQIGLSILPESCPWHMEQALSQNFYPD